MKLELDAQKLAETRVWQQEFFDRQVARIQSMLRHYLEVDLPQALRYVDYDRDKATGPRTHADAAAQIAYELVQTVANCDLRGLNDIAADLSTTISAHDALLALRADMPAELREAWDAHERGGKEGRDSKRAADVASRAEKASTQCQAAVPESGRGVGFRQCGNRGRGPTTYRGVTYRDCGRHARFHPHKELDRVPAG